MPSSIVIAAFAAVLAVANAANSIKPINGALPALTAEPNDDNTFDYVVVGAGTAGLTLASRLSEDGSRKVAVIEAGDNLPNQPINELLVNIPGACALGPSSDDGDHTFQTGIDWQYKTVPQKAIGGRILRYARGKASGGTSNRHFMIYERPTSDSIDLWANYTGDSSWKWSNVLPYYKRSVTFTPPVRGINRRNEVPAAQYVRSDFGSDRSAPLQVSYPNTPQNFSHYMFGAANELGIKTIPSFNGGDLLGAQYSAASIDPKNGWRSTSRAFYEAAKYRPNLKALWKTQANKVVLTKGSNGKPTASAVLVDGFLGGIVYAKREVILSAGVFQSPQLLMLSGIGPKDQLDKFEIKSIIRNDNIGQNMQDHVFISGPTHEVLKETNTFTDVAADVGYLAAAYLNFSGPVTGLLTSNIADFLTWERPSAATLNKIGAGELNSLPPKWPIFEGISAPGVVNDFNNLLATNFQAGINGSRYSTVLMSLSAPLSRGTVTLASADPKVLPIIDPRWLSDPVDQAVAVYAFKRARQYFTTKAMQPVLVKNRPEYLPGPSVNTDAKLLEWIKAHMQTEWHGASTCAMRKQSDGGVLDSKLTVYGTNNLRVVDASAMPRLPPGHPQPTIYMLAERAADLIKAASGSDSTKRDLESDDDVHRHLSRRAFGHAH